MNSDGLQWAARAPARIGAIVMIVACAVAGNGTGAAHGDDATTTLDEPGTFNIAGKAGDCDLDPSKHVVPFAHSDAEPKLCRPEERHVMAEMEGCLDRLPACRSGHEREWTREVEGCLSIAAPVSDGCLGAFVGPPGPRPLTLK